MAVPSGPTASSGSIASSRPTTSSGLSASSGPTASSGPSADFIGAGWSFPLSIDPTGRFGLVRGDREIAESIRLILGTAPGERPMRPEFGCALHDYVFAPANAATAAAVADSVRTALDQWEPRIDLLDVQVSFRSVDLCVLHIDISYRIKGSNDRRNLVFPFYLLPDEPGPGGPAEWNR